MSGVEVRRLQPEDRAAWQPLARGYHTFYERTLPDDDYDAGWARLMGDPRFVGLAAWHEGRLVGIAHALFHAATWSGDVCYLQDLFVDEAARGRGAAAALIDALAALARERRAPRLYWTTHTSNARARALYDRVAAHKGFLRYDYPVA